MNKNIQTQKIIYSLKDVALAVTGAFDLDSLLQSIVESCTTLSNASRGALFLYDENTSELVMRAEKGNAPELRFNARYSIEKTIDFKQIGLTAYIFHINDILVLNSPETIINHFAHNGKYDKEQYPGKEKCQSWVGIPLKNPTKKHPIGVLKVENTIDRKPTIKFSDQEIEIFKIISDIAASAIIKFQHRFSKIQKSINRLSKVLKGTEGLNTRLREIVSTFKEITCADGASIWIIEGSKLICRSGVGHYEGMEGTASYDLSFDLRDAKKVGLTAWIARSGEFVNIKSHKELICHPQHRGTYDIKNYPDYTDKKCESFIGAPLKIGDTTIGVIKADNRIPDCEHPESFFTEEEAQVFYYLAIITAIAVQNDQDFEKARVHDKQLNNLYKIGAECSNIEDPNTIFWYLLVGLTHNDGVGFNRSILFDFYYEGGPCLIGRMAIGPYNLQEGFEIQKALDSRKLTLNLEDCKREIERDEKKPPSSRLQHFIETQRIDLDSDCSFYQDIMDKNQPTGRLLDINTLSPALKQFLIKIDSIYVNNSQIFSFSFPNVDGHMIAGFCDFVYSNNDLSDFRVNEAQTFINQISLAVSRLSLKKTDQEMREKAWKEFSATTAHRIGTETADMGGALYWVKKSIQNIQHDKNFENYTSICI